VQQVSRGSKVPLGKLALLDASGNLFKVEHEVRKACTAACAYACAAGARPPEHRQQCFDARTPHTTHGRCSGRVCAFTRRGRWTPWAAPARRRTATRLQQAAAAASGARAAQQQACLRPCWRAAPRAGPCTSRGTSWSCGRISGGVGVGATVGLHARQHSAACASLRVLCSRPREGCGESFAAPQPCAPHPARWRAPPGALAGFIVEVFRGTHPPAAGAAARPFVARQSWFTLQVRRRQGRRQPPPGAVCSPACAPPGAAACRSRP
jgi:hypothetical protein